MRSVPSHRLAFALFALFGVLLATLAVMILWAPPPPPGVAPITSDAAFFSLALLGIMAVGALVAGRHPANPVGWLLCAFCLLQLLSPLTYVYAAAAFTDGWSLPGGGVAAWLTAWLWIPAIAVIGMALLLFPDGTLPSREWRWAVMASAGGLAASLALGVALWPRRGVGLLTLGDDFGGVSEIPATMALVLCFLTFVAGAASIVFRFLRSQGESRLQIKWVMYATCLAAAGLVGFAYADAALAADPVWVAVLSTLGLLAIPAAMGVAIFRYRLYAIDRIISRTVSYALLSGGMLAVYTVASLILSSLLQPVAGSNELAVAGSTLTAAAVFTPARRRIQSTVDRRFNRSRYDAVLTIETFTGRLRSERDFDSLSSDLISAVSATLQPAHVSLWLQRGNSEFRSRRHR